MLKFGSETVEAGSAENPLRQNQPAEAAFPWMDGGAPRFMGNLSTSKEFGSAKILGANKPGRQGIR